MEAAARRDGNPAPSADRSYYRTRAEAELTRARGASHPGAARAHYLIAGFYMDRFYGDGVANALALTPDDQALPGDGEARPQHFPGD